MRSTEDASKAEKIAVNTAVVASELSRLAPFDGVTGYINFDGEQTPGNKRLALMHVEKVNDLSETPRVIFSCGAAGSRDVASSGEASSAKGLPLPCRVW